MNKLKLAVFGVLGTLMLMTSFSCFAQEKVDSDVLNSAKYRALKDHYIELTEIVKKQEEQPAAKDFLKKIGQDNFINATQNGNNLTEWLEDNWQSTSFISFLTILKNARQSSSVLNLVVKSHLYSLGTSALF